MDRKLDEVHDEKQDAKRNRMENIYQSTEYILYVYLYSLCAH